MHGIFFPSIGNVRMRQIQYKYHLLCFLLHRTRWFHQNIISKIENKLKTSNGVSVANSKYTVL